MAPAQNGAFRRGRRNPVAVEIAIQDCQAQSTTLARCQTVFLDRDPQETCRTGLHPTKAANLPPHVGFSNLPRQVGEQVKITL
jgi:hypothetical protein